MTIEVEELIHTEEIGKILNDPKLTYRMTPTKDNADKEFIPDFKNRRYIGFYSDNEIYGVIWFSRLTNICAEFHPCLKPSGLNGGRRMLVTHKLFEEWVIQNTNYLKLNTTIPVQSCSNIISCAIKGGFNYEGLLKQHILYHEKLEDCAVLGKFLDRGF